MVVLRSLGFLLVMGLPWAVAQGLEAFVFKVRASDCRNGSERALTGFLMPEEGGIVTALHGVIGCERVHAFTVRGSGPDRAESEVFRDLALIEVDLRHDVALLGSDDVDAAIAENPSAGLFPARALPERSLPGDIRVVGYPHDLDELIDTDLIRLRDRGSTDLWRLIPVHERNLFERCGSPSATITVFNIEGTLRPGESGAPLLTGANLVIGIVMGGLNAGMDEIVWAGRWSDVRLVLNDPDDGSLQTALLARAATSCLTDRFAAGLDTKVARAITHILSILQDSDAEPERLARLWSVLERLWTSDEERKLAALELLAEGRIEAAIGVLSASAQEEPAGTPADAQARSRDYYDLALLQTFTDPQRSLENLGRAVELDPDNLDALGELGLLQFRVGSTSDAEATFETLQDRARRAGKQDLQAHALNQLGWVQSRQGDFRDAIDSHLQALDLDRATGNRRGEADDLNGLGDAYLSVGRYEDAIARFQQALALYEFEGDREGEGDVLGNLGIAHEKQGRYLDAERFLERAIAIHREVEDDQSEANDLNGLGTVYRELGRHDDAIAAYQGALAIHRRIGDRGGELDDLNGLGNVFLSMGLYEGALEKLTEALAIAREIEDREGEAEIHGNLGIVHVELAAYTRAIEHTTLALHIDREMGDLAGVAADLNNLGRIYQRMARYDDAIAAYREALAVYETIDSPENRGRTLANLGLAYRDSGRRSEAVAHLRQALEIFERDGSPLQAPVERLLRELTGE